MRDYTDETLNFCLDDGVALLEGPARAEEPVTALMIGLTGESPTRLYVADERDLPVSTLNQASSRRSAIIFLSLGALLITALGFGSYWFYAYRAKQIESIAVMPFINESANPEFEYLSDGITETLISSLSQIPGLAVKARSSVFRYKGKETNAATIGRELSVEALLNGRIVQRGNQLSLSLELIDAATENVIWSDQYFRPQTDLISLQSQIARDVAQKLRTKLSAPDEQRVTRKYTDNTEAYKFYLKGRYQLGRRTEDGFDKGIVLFQQALEHDPGYAPAYAGLADAYNQMGMWMLLPPAETFPKAKAAAERALQMDDTLAEAHTSLAVAKFYYDWDFRAAEAEFQKALGLDPNHASAHELYGYEMYLADPRRVEEAMLRLNTARDLDPLSMTINFEIAALYYFERNYDEAIRRLDEIHRMDPGFTLGYGLLSVVYGRQGKHDESVAAALKGSSLEGGGLTTEQITILRSTYAKSGIQSYHRKHAQLLQERAKQQYVSPVFVAMDHMSAGDNELAIEWLEKAYSERASWLTEIGVDPIWDDLRSDPRFQDLSRRVRLVKAN